MANYVHATTQTDALLLSAAPSDTPTPPDDTMLTDKPQFAYGGAVPRIARPHTPEEPTSPTTTLLERRRNLLGIDARLDLPKASHELNDEVPYSPPPTHALLSPIPEANRRHAGHTPLIPRSLSPERDPLAAVQAQTSDAPDDTGLKGALTLPANPTDGTQDETHIRLDALDAVLGRIEQQQKALRGDEKDTARRVDSADAGAGDLALSRVGSTESRREIRVDEVDGVLLKQPPTNFGAPLGQL